jgi:hypothetical protein
LSHGTMANALCETYREFGYCESYVTDQECSGE